MKEAQYLISYLQQCLAEMGYEWEDIPEDKSQYLYIPNKDNPSIVIRIANHICSMWEFTKNVKPSTSVKFVSIVFKEEEYNGNNKGLWDAKGEEVIFEDIDKIFNEWWVYLDIIFQDIVNYINDNTNYSDSTSLATIVPLRIETIVKAGGSPKLSWNGEDEDPLIAYRKLQNKKGNNSSSSSTSSASPTVITKESKSNKYMKRTITESQLRAIVAESVKRVLFESKGKDKLKNSFKSKEDMTQYRDLYEPNASNAIIDTDNSLYDTEYTDNGTLGSGPYMNYRHHTFADDYDYCGDDDYNDYASDYNHALRKRLATKGGQMSYDWDTEFNKEKEGIERQHRDLERHADNRFAADIANEKLLHQNAARRYVNGEDPAEIGRPLKHDDDLDNTWGNYIRRRQYADEYGMKDKPLSYWRREIADEKPIDRKRAIETLDRRRK